MAKALAKFKTYVDGKVYFVDLVLSQLRAVDNPHDFVQYDDPIQLVMELRQCEKMDGGKYV